MVYSSDWLGRAGHRSSWEAVPLHVRFRRYDTGEHYYIQKAEQTFLLQFECFDLLASGPPQLHRCIGLPEVWFAWVEGNRTRVHGISDFRQLLEQIRGNRLLWWRAFESEEEAEVRPESKPADWQNWDPLPDSDTQKWLTSQRLRARKPDSSLVNETPTDSAEKPLCLRTPKPLINQDFYVVAIDGRTSMYTVREKFEKHIAKCPGARWQKFDNVKDALVSVSAKSGLLTPRRGLGSVAEKAFRRTPLRRSAPRSVLTSRNSKVLAAARWSCRVWPTAKTQARASWAAESRPIT